MGCLQDRPSLRLKKADEIVELVGLVSSQAASKRSRSTFCFVRVSLLILKWLFKSSPLYTPPPRLPWDELFFNVLSSVRSERPRCPKGHKSSVADRGTKPMDHNRVRGYPGPLLVIRNFDSSLPCRSSVKRCL